MVQQTVAPRFRVELHETIPARRLVSAYVQERLLDFRPKIRLRQENSRFILKTAETPDEVHEALLLRHEVFYLELLRRPNLLGLDVDRFDFDFDHLLIIEKEHMCVVGTYRLNPSAFNHEFYSSTEFDLRNLIALPGHKVEIGRSCVHHGFRNSLVIAMLWRGLTEYVKASQSRYLFGCTSVMTTDVEQIAAVYAKLQEGHFAGLDRVVVPKPRCAVKNLERYVRFLQTLPPVDRPDPDKIIPPLMHAYLRAGAMVCGAPALDPAFGCADFLTLLDFGTMGEAYGKKFSGN